MTPERIAELRYLATTEPDLSFLGYGAVRIVAEMLDEIERLRGLVPRWRDPAAESPPASTECLVFIHRDDWHETLVAESCDCDGTWSEPGHRDIASFITAWMPLPAPPNA